jgi:hypothetical protein
VVQTGFIWLRIDSGGWVLWTQWWIIRFHKREHFLTSWVTISFWRTLLHGDSYFLKWLEFIIKQVPYRITQKYSYIPVQKLMYRLSEKSPYPCYCNNKTCNIFIVPNYESLTTAWCDNSVMQNEACGGISSVSLKLFTALTSYHTPPVHGSSTSVWAPLQLAQSYMCLQVEMSSVAYAAMDTGWMPSSPGPSSCDHTWMNMVFQVLLSISTWTCMVNIQWTQ